jgi:hypothetical protein
MKERAQVAVLAVVAAVAISVGALPEDPMTATAQDARAARPPIDLALPARLETATFALG